MKSGSSEYLRHRRLRGVWFGSHLLDGHEVGRFRITVEDVKTEVFDHRLAGEDAADAVAAFIKGRGEDSDSHFTWHDGNDSAAHAAFGGETDAVGPVAGE